MALCPPRLVNKGQCGFVIFHGSHTSLCRTLETIEAENVGAFPVYEWALKEKARTHNVESPSLAHSTNSSPPSGANTEMSSLSSSDAENENE